MKDQSKKGDVILLIFYMAFRAFPFKDALFIFVELRLVVRIAEIYKKVRNIVNFIDLLLRSFFTSCIFTARTLDFAVKFRLAFKYEAVVFRRYVLALLSVGLLRKFEAYLFYLSLI